MSGGHGNQGLLLHGHGRLHRLAPECKLVGTFAFVVTVVATPREAVASFGALAGLLGLLVLSARLPPGRLLRRLAFVLPFLGFALLLPWVGTGERVVVGAVALSREGLWAGWNIGVKATLGGGAAILLTAVTPMSDLLHGLDRLRVPRPITAIGGFMVRYADVITGEMRRMRIAREARGYDPRVLWHARAVASGLGTLFIRSFERGERVYLAMTARGYDGSLPSFAARRAAPGEWATTLAFTAAAGAAAAGAGPLS